MKPKLRVMLFGIVLILGTLNREMTGILLLLSWLVLYGVQDWKLSFVFIAITVGLIAGLRYGIGIEPTEFTLAATFDFNASEWGLLTALLNHALLLPFWLLLWLNRRAMPTHYRRLLLILVPYAILLVLLASWREIRLLLPFAILLLPMVKIRLH